MSQKILTIAIPAYNMEKYIGRCLDSVVSGRNLDKLDIIVVNDGSKDRTLEIAKRYETDYPQSVRVIDKPNGGWGTAINRTIEEAVGKYYKSLDSDDWFDTEDLDEFVDLLERIDVDMVLTSFNEVNEAGEKTGGIHWTELTDKVYSFDDYLSRIEKDYYSTIHAVCYKSSRLKNNAIRVSDKYYGDLDYINTPLIYVKSIYVSQLNIYRYFVGREGQSISVAGYRAHIDDYLAVAKKSAILSESIPSDVSWGVKQLLWNESQARALWAYKLLMLPSYLGNDSTSTTKLKEFDAFLKQNARGLYDALNGVKAKGFIPYIRIWRLLGLNLFKLIGK